MKVWQNVPEVDRGCGADRAFFGGAKGDTAGALEAAKSAEAH